MVRGRVLSGRMRAYGYAVVTTALFLLFTLAESATQNYVSAHSRLAGTTIEIAIVLLLALAFRPLHQRVELLIETAFYKRRHEAREALVRLRKELTSFNDAQQILRRVIEAVDHHMGAAGCAVYLRHGTYAAQASSFDVAAGEVPLEDALVIRLRSSAAPADPRALASAALGEMALPMMAAGDLIGFLTLTPKHVEYDPEDRHALAALAESTGVALLALDPRLREGPKRRSRPNNLPRQTTSFVGRREEVVALEELVRNNPLVTIVGVGGMGKTRLALQVAGNLLEETTEGAWFVDLAPVGDEDLVASAILSVLDADQSGEAEPLERIIKHLAQRAFLLVLDNCEHLLGGVARVTAAIVARCSQISILATSREPLGIAAETVHQVSSLDDASAAELFTERARSFNERFELTDTNFPVVVDVCRRLDGMALAIELAAARTRSISLDELSHHLQLRLLGGSGREPIARHQTMHALIDWSYDLLSEREQRLFLQLAPFVGGATLDAIAQTSCCEELDRYELLDVVTSLVDKSLLVAEIGETTQRYRLLESIRAYAKERLERSGDAHAVLLRYAQTFADFADRTYQEFDTGPQPDWLERSERELDNVRTAMSWALANGDHRELAARMAGGFGVVFLRLTLLQEGIDWCERALENTDTLTPAVTARMWYVLSMLQNNQWQHAQALRAAERAVDAYHAAGDNRGRLRALSQVAQQLAKNDRDSEALAKAIEAIELARQLGDDAVLASVLARAASAYDANAIERKRELYRESAAIYDNLGRESDRARIMQWWLNAEILAGNLKAAATIIETELQDPDDDFRISVSGIAAFVYWTLGDRDRAVTATREAFTLAQRARQPVYLSAALVYVAMIAEESDPERAALILGYAEGSQEELGWRLDAHERSLWDQFSSRLRSHLGTERALDLRTKGRRMSEAEVIAVASKC
jgi:predicted ATPase